ncbi:MAG: AAA family ATPase [Candidatus Binatia bacterium]
MEVSENTVAKGNGKQAVKPEGPENFLLSECIDMPVKSPEMIFEDLWPARTMGLFTGDGGVGKTHLALQLLVAIASGSEIEGIPFRCPTSRDVVYITQEDEADFIRGELLCQHPELKTQPEISERIRIISTALRGENLFLGNPKLCSYIAGNLTEGSVFVLDSWSTFLGTNESDNTELMKREIAPLRGIMKDRNATPLIIHHRPKPNQAGFQSSFRGGTALPNSCRFHIMIESAGVEVKLSFEKVSRGAKPDPLKLVFDEDSRLFVPGNLDRYVTVFRKVGKELTTSQVIEKLGKDPTDQKERKRVLNALGQRDAIQKILGGKKGQDAVWKRVK